MSSIYQNFYTQAKGIYDLQLSLQILKDRIEPLNLSKGEIISELNKMIIDLEIVIDQSSVKFVEVKGAKDE